MRLIIKVIFLSLFTVPLHGQVKYVFYFIGDGMGVNHVNATEMYLASLQGKKVDRMPLCFTQFPVVSMATTFSADKPVTDSSAAGTALATGLKTKNGMLGMNKDSIPIHSIAYNAKESGKQVGIVTNVGINHATPAAFYAHQTNRSSYYDIAIDLCKSGFDFFGGSGFLKSANEKTTRIYNLCKKANYILAFGYNDYINKAPKARKLILLQQEEKDYTSLPFAINRDENDLTLAEITKAAVDFLYNENGINNGFFLMVEGGKIDWSSHANDAATTFQEVIDFEKAVQVAFHFYLTHPEETLIVVTADHETGGLSMGESDMDLSIFQYQTCSIDRLSNKISVLRNRDEVNWDDIKKLLSIEMGFWDQVPLNEKQEKTLQDEYVSTFIDHSMKYEKNLYSSHEPLAARAKEIINEKAIIKWAHRGHTAGYVPVYAIGNGSELFSPLLDISDIPRIITKIADY